MGTRETIAHTRGTATVITDNELTTVFDRKAQPMPQPHDPATSGGTDTLERTDEALSVDNPWQVLLWNDPVNTTDYVTLTLVRVLDVTQDAAELLMLQAHAEGKAAVTQATRGKAQTIATALMSAGLWATMEKVA